jgi:hypothetical protein
MVRDQLDPQILNLDPERSLTRQSEPTVPPPAATVAGQQVPSISGLTITKAKPKLRRKKVYWNRVEAREGNIWSAVLKLDPILKHDSSEFERLFSQSIDAVKEDKQNIASCSTSPSVKNVKVIE